MHTRTRPALGDLVAASLFLGVVGFGGGISVLSMIRTVAVERRKWLTDREFDNMATVAQMLPGGAAANLLACIGLRFAGIFGAAIGYCGFILPGGVAVLALAWGYVRFGTTPHADLLLAGVNAAVVGLIAAITFKMVKSSIVRLWQMGLAAGALLMSLVGGASSGELAFLGIGAGLAIDLGIERARLLRFGRKERAAPKVALPEEGDPLPHAAPASRDVELGTPAWVSVSVLLGTAAWLGAGSELVRLALVFFRTGLGAYGGGFAIIPHLQSTLRANGWLNAKQFADAVAVGKLTPGPVLLMATFIGFVLHGVPGALVATVAIFAAPFILVVLLSTWLDRMRSRRWVRAALRGLTPTVVGLMAGAALTLGTTLDGPVETGIAASIALTSGRFDVNPAALIALGGLTRIAFHAWGHV